MRQLVHSGADQRPTGQKAELCAAAATNKLIRIKITPSELWSLCSLWRIMETRAERQVGASGMARQARLNEKYGVRFVFFVCLFNKNAHMYVCGSARK